MMSILMMMAAAIANPAPTAVSNDDKAVVCVRPPSTGSLVGTKKVCRTNREWRELKRAQNKRARDHLAPAIEQSTTDAR